MYINIKDEKMKKIVEELETSEQCTCDLDAWEPSQVTGHTQVCDIHLLAMENFIKG